MADTLNTQIAYARVYAEALFELAQQHKCIAETREQLDELVKLDEHEPSFNAFMTSAALDDGHRAAGLERMFRGKLNDLVLNTLLVMNDKGRHGLLRGLQAAFVVLQEEAAGEIEATVVSAVELDEEQARAANDVCARVSGKKPLTTFRVDESLIGGLIVQVGDLRFDNSVRRQIAAAAVRLHERSERGLEIGTQ